MQAGKRTVSGLGKMFGAGESATFMGLPTCPDLAEVETAMVLIGADCATPYPSVGAYCAGGPAAIRAGGAAYAANLQHVNFDLGGPVFAGAATASDAGDLALDPTNPAGNRRTIRQAVGKVLDKDAVPFVLGGDDSIPIPMLEAFGGRGRRFTILQIDAHIDWRDEVDGERLGLSSTMRRASEMPHVAGIVQVGQRGIGSARMEDRQAALERGVAFVSARQLAAEGVARATVLVPEGGEVIVCLDLDALDPSIMPAVIGRTAGGLSYWQVIELIAAVSGRSRIAGFDMVEFMPSRDIDGQGALVAAQLLAAVFGLVARARSGV